MFAFDITWLAIILLVQKITKMTLSALALKIAGITKRGAFDTLKCIWVEHKTYVTILAKRVYARYATYL